MVRLTSHPTSNCSGRTRRRAHLASLATLFAVGLASFGGSSCEAGGERPAVAEVSAPDVSRRVAMPPCEDGKIRECTVTLGEYGGILSCFEGTQICHNGEWDPCSNGKSYSRPGVGLRPASVRGLLSLSRPAPCEADPCNPDCQSFQEEPDAAVEAEQDDSVFEWTEGSLSAFPTGLRKKALVEPCGSAYDCQFNYECVHPVTGSECAHSKCAMGVALDPTCEDGKNRKDFPSCVSRICAASPSCCATPYSGRCDHDPCSVGSGLDGSCHGCVDDVCDEDPACCSTVVDTPVNPTQPLAAEAENATGNTAQGTDSWTNDRDNSASGDYGMQAGPDNGTLVDAGYVTGAPRLDFRLDFPSAGTWYVWIRGHAKRRDESNSDSLHVGLDGAAQPSAERVTGFTSALGWTRQRMNTAQAASLSVSTAGQHTVNVWMREDGFWFDKIVLTTNAMYTPSGGGPAENGLVRGGGWTAQCVELYEEKCGLTCPAASEWTQECVDQVRTVCGAECATPATATCSHSVCSVGDALDAECHPCVTAVCKADPLCCISGWDPSCVNRVSSACGQSCPVDMVLPPTEEGTCQPRLPGQVDSTCDKADLAMGIPCDGALAVCNHGTQATDGRVRVVHYPGNSAYFGMNEPEQTAHAGMIECFVDEPIPPGRCVTVTNCPGLKGNREIMINPPGDDQIDECTTDDNWTMTSEVLNACEAPACAATQSAATFKPVHLYFMVDKSTSMSWDNKWTGAVAALKAFFSSPSSAGLDVALEFFPLRAGGVYGDGCGDTSSPLTMCNATPCSNPMVDAAVLSTETGGADAQEHALLTALDSVVLEIWTPTYPALDGALRWARAGQATNPNDVYAVVFVTDGEPTLCELSTNEIAKLALAAYMDSSIRTYTIGMEGANTEALDTIARAGGTGSSFTVRSGENVENDLLDALNSISGDVARCQFEITNAEAINPNDASVVYTPGDDSAPIELPRVGDISGCGTGWYYDDPNHPTTATLCPETCSVVQADASAGVDVRIACAAAYSETEITEVYRADCPEGTVPQWGYFAWNCTTAGDSSVDFSIRAAATAEELSSAGWVDLAQVKATSENEQCPLGSTHPGCRAALYDVLDGAPAAHYYHAEVRAVLKPSADGTAGPSLHDWELTYSCIVAD